MTTRIISYVGWTIVVAASLYFLYNNALHYFSYDKADFDPGGFWPNFAPALMTHIVGGMIALLLGPFQFIARLRNNYPKVHRTTGKIYLISIAVASIASLYLSIDKILITEKAIVFGSGLAMLAFSWLLTSGMAYYSVRKHNYDQHREWMVRSFVVTCAFVTFRLINNTLVDDFHTDPGATAGLMAWACWSIPLLIAEPFIQGSKIKKQTTITA